MNDSSLVNEQFGERLPMPGKAMRLMTLFGVYGAGAFAEVLSKTAEMQGAIERNDLPEPWDFPDHIGNFNEAGLYTAAAFSLLANILTRRSGENYQNKLKKAAVGALAVSASIQIVGEKYGDVVGLNTGDMIDAGYGVAFSAVAAVGCYFGYKNAHKSDVKRYQLLQKQAGEASPSTSQKPLNSSDKAIAKRTNPQQRKATRKQQQASRKKNRNRR